MTRLPKKLNGMIRERVMAGLEGAKAQGVTLGRPKVARKVETAIRARLARGEGILKVAKGRGCQHRPAGQAGGRYSSELIATLALLAVIRNSFP